MLNSVHLLIPYSQIIGAKVFLSNLSDMYVFYKEVLISYVWVISVMWHKNYCPVFSTWAAFIVECSEFTPHYMNLNIGLLNSLSFWHPLNLIIIVSNICLLPTGPFSNLSITILCCFVFLSLGSWWSAQELLWQGWWNWDGIENNLLLLFIYVFVITHIKRNAYNVTYNLLLFSIFAITHFEIFNKTNIFKSIHSFANSPWSNVSNICLFYVILLYLRILRTNRRILTLFYYNFFIWFPFVAYFVFTGAPLFSILSFFFYINLVTVLFTVSYMKTFTLPIVILSVAAQPSYLSLLLIFFNHFRLFFFKNFRYLHVTISVALIYVLSFVMTNSLCYFNLNINYAYLQHNPNYSNNLIHVVVHNLHSFSAKVKSDLLIVFKNTLFSSAGAHYSAAPFNLLAKIQYKFNLYDIKWVIAFIVTEVYYLKQKPRFKYYM